MSRLDSSGWEPSLAIARGKNWFVNWADFPALAVDRSGRMAATWLEKSGEDTHAYGIKFSLSSDNGKTWSMPNWLHDDTTETEHGFVSLAPAKLGGFHSVWLDGREMVHDGPMTLRYARLELNGQKRDERVIDDRVCDCCQTSCTVVEDGALVVAYRDRSSEEVRDISILRLTDSGWSQPMVVHSDGWKIAGCPANGPVIVSRWSEVTVAWFTTGINDSGIVQSAWSGDGGRSVGAPARTKAGSPIGRVGLSVGPPIGTYVSWVEAAGAEARILIQAVPPEGIAGSLVEIAKTSAQRDSGFPHIECDGSKLIVAWTDVTEGPRVRTSVITFTSW